MLVLDNGAYCKRAAKLTPLMGRKCHGDAVRRGCAGVGRGAWTSGSKSDPSMTHVVLMHCETGTGVENPLADIAARLRAPRQGPDRRCDESSFGALPIDARQIRFDALVAASGKCLEGVPGMGFVFLRKAMLDALRRQQPEPGDGPARPALYMEKTGQWRFTPPTHVVVALAEAVAQFVEEGGQPARLARYTDNCQTLIDGMAALGFKPFLKPEIQAPIIVTFHAPGAQGLRVQALLRRQPSSAASSSIPAS